MRIMLVEFSPVGGLLQYVVQFADGLASTEVEVHLVTARDPEVRPRSSKVHVHSILPITPPSQGPDRLRVASEVVRVGRGLRYLWAWIVVFREVIRRRPDVVQLADWRFSVDGLSAAVLARVPGGPAVIDLAHTPVPLVEQPGRGGLYKRSRLLRAALAAGYRNIDAVMVLGNRSMAELKDAWGPIRRVDVIPHGNYGILAGDAVTLPASATPPVVLFFGTWTRYKGIDLLLDAFEVLRSRLPEAQLVMAGAVSGEVDAAQVRRRAEKIGNVDLRPGYVASQEVPALFGGCRVVVAPYRAANQSGVTHLAQSFARPVVVTDVGDLAAAVGDDVGLVVPADDIEALASGMERLLRDGSLAERLGRAGADRLAREASWQAVVRAVTPVYHEVLDARRRTHR